MCAYEKNTHAWQVDVKGIPFASHKLKKKFKQKCYAAWTVLWCVIRYMEVNIRSFFLPLLVYQSNKVNLTFKPLSSFEVCVCNQVKINASEQVKVFLQ